MVVIKGLKMPKCCEECPLFHYYFDIEGVMHFICKYGNVEIFEYEKKRNATCPLKEDSLEQEPCEDDIITKYYWKGFYDGIKTEKSRTNKQQESCDSQWSD